MGTKSKAMGTWGVNGRQVVKNTLTQDAFDLVATLVTAGGGAYFGSIRILDGSDGTIATGAITFSFDNLGSGTGVEITGEALFTGAQVTADIHKVQLLSTTGVVLAEATLPEVIPEESTVTITRTDTFTPGD